MDVSRWWGFRSEHSHKQRGAAAVETSSAKHRESTQRKIKDYKTQVTSHATIETPATLSAARIDCCHAMRFDF
jgi:hypothetical protein